MRYDKIKFIIIKKIRDIIFLIIFGRGNFFFLFLKTNVKHIFLVKSSITILKIQIFLINGFLIM